MAGPTRSAMRASTMHRLERTLATATCSRCRLREVCLPDGASGDALAHIDQRLVALRRRVARGQLLLRAGDRFDAVFAVWSGVFKTRTQSAARERITGFQMGGELIGLDAIDRGRHGADAVALENACVCEIPFGALEALSRDLVPLQQQLHRLLSREIAHQQATMLLLGGHDADARLAAFLLDLAQRLAARGYSASSLVLRMSRREIGSFLGLTLETVSRSFSRLQAMGALAVQRRQVLIADAAALERPAGA